MSQYIKLLRYGTKTKNCVIFSEWCIIELTNCRDETSDLLSSFGREKGAIFLPAKKVFPTYIAVFLTFVASGFFHDFVNSCIFYKSIGATEYGKCDGCYDYKYGSMTSFFLFTGLMMMLQKPVGQLSVIQWMSKHFPTVVVSTLLVVIHLPVAHWYYGSWVAGGFFVDAAFGFWQIRKL